LRAEVQNGLVESIRPIEDRPSSAVGMANTFRRLVAARSSSTVAR
jgi:hypothetical protein